MDRDKGKKIMNLAMIPCTLCNQDTAGNHALECPNNPSNQSASGGTVGYGKHIDITDQQLNPPLPRKEGYQPDNTDKPEGLNPPTEADTIGGNIPRKEVISIQPGDVVVVTVPDKCTLAECESLTRNVEYLFPGIKSMILDEGASLEVYREQGKVDKCPCQCKTCDKTCVNYREQVKDGD